VTDIAWGLSVSGWLLLNTESVQDLLRNCYQYQKMQQCLERSRRQSKRMCVVRCSELEQSLNEKEGVFPPGCYPVGNQRNEENLSLSPIQLLVPLCCTFHSFVITSVSQSGIVFCLSGEHSLKLF